MTAAVLTISDSSFLKMRKDESGPAVSRRLVEAGFTVTMTEVIPDEQHLIAKRILEIADSNSVRAIITTGGTGITERDVTPEAILKVLDKELPGLGELMRSEGLKKTPLAVLSRSTAGTRGRCFVAALPGSPKGAVESLDAILKLVPHILDLIDGNTNHEQTVPGNSGETTAGAATSE